MNWKLIFGLSLFGLFMAISTVFWMSAIVERISWLLVILASAYVLARNAPGKFFLHGLLTSIANSVWITSIHIALSSTFLANRPEEAAMMAQMPFPDSPWIMMLLVGPIVGVIFGIVLGFCAWVASKFVPRTVA